MDHRKGIQCIPSRHSVTDTLHRVEALLREHGIKVFARTDHGAEAEQAGLVKLLEAAAA